MKKLTILIALLLVGISANAFAQGVSATASTTATIIAPIGITRAVDMVFGNIATDGTAGTVTLATNNTRTPSASVTLASGITVTAAAFNVTGSGSFTYNISLPGAPITLNGGSANVTVGTFLSSPSGTGALTAGAQTVFVGATLNLPAGVTAGTYENLTDLTVTVSYN